MFRLLPDQMESGDENGSNIGESNPRRTGVGVVMQVIAVAVMCCVAVSAILHDNSGLRRSHLVNAINEGSYPPPPGHGSYPPPAGPPGQLPLGSPLENYSQYPPPPPPPGYGPLDPEYPELPLFEPPHLDPGHAVPCNDLRTVCDADPFDAAQDCQALHAAMRGAGADEAAVTAILTKRSSTQRVQISEMYKTKFGKDLKDDLRSEKHGNLEELFLALLDPTPLYMAKSLRRAMRGKGTDSSTLIDILMTLTNAGIEQVKKEYKGYYDRNLSADLKSETSGHFTRALVSMLQGDRDESTDVDLEKAKTEAQELYDAGEGFEERFITMVASRNKKQLQATFAEYEKIAHTDILNSINRETSGDLEAGFTAMVMNARNPAEYFADRLWKSMKGAGTDDFLLIRIIVERSEVDLQVIKQLFEQKYRRTLYKIIEGDCSGDYKKALLSMVGA